MCIDKFKSESTRVHTHRGTYTDLVPRSFFSRTIWLIKWRKCFQATPPRLEEARTWRFDLHTGRASVPDIVRLKSLSSTPVTWWRLVIGSPLALRVHILHFRFTFVASGRSRKLMVIVGTEETRSCIWRLKNQKAQLVPVVFSYVSSQAHCCHMLSWAGAAL